MVPHNEVEAAKDTVLRLLHYCPRSIKEVSDRLTKKGFSRNAVEKSIAVLKGAGLLDDLKFAKDWISAKLEKSPRAKAILIEELTHKGIDESVIQNAFSSFPEVLDEYAMAKKVLKKRFKESRGVTSESAIKKLYLYLKRCGFSDEITEKILRDTFTIDEF
ncbi:MAG: regulatory protein RecX [Candidatus Omnitrophota bacterium]